MPELNISKSNFDFFWVYAVMAHPDNERYQQEFVATSISRSIHDATEEGNDIEIPKSILSVLLNAPSYDDVMERATNNAVKGAVSGDILDYVAQMHLTGHKEPSVRKAVFVAEDYLSSAVDAHGKKCASSDISIRKCWEEYKNVAHLWAAFRVCLLTPNKNFPKLNETLFGDKLEEFLAIAEFFRLFGEGFKPLRIKSQESLLPRGKTWRVPKDYTLPTIYLGLHELPTWMTDRLKTFKNPIKN